MEHNTLLVQPTKTKPVTWSYSKLNRFNQCPHRYYEIDVARSIPYSDTEKSLYGDRGHEAIDKNIKIGKPIPKEFSHIEKAVEKFKDIRGKVYTEQKLAITQDYRPTDWFAKDVWGRSITDATWIAGEKAVAVDWKFGKPRKETMQLEIGALVLFCHYPAIEQLNTAFVWFQTGKLGEVEKYKRDDISWMWNDVMPDIRRLEAAHANNLFPPRPSGLCNYCPVINCQFWRSKDGTGNQKGR